MQLCSEGHDEVCYEGIHCPACLLKEDRDYYEDECAKLNKKVEELEDEIIELENRNA